MTADPGRPERDAPDADVPSDADREVEPRGSGAGGMAPAAGGRSHRSTVPAERFLADRREEDAALEAAAERETGGPRLQWPLLVVLAGLVASLLVVVDDHFRRGSVLFAGFVVLAFFLRLILSESNAGWLAVRSRAVDLAVLAGFGLGLTVFALIVPSPS